MSATDQTLALPPPAGHTGQDETAERPRLHVVEAPARSNSAWYLVAYAVVIVATILGAVGLNALAAGDAVLARDLDRDVASGEREYTLLIAEVARLETPARIRAAARELGMVPASDPTYLRVDALPGELEAAARRAAEDRAEGSDGGAQAAGEDPLKPVLSVQR